jgi:DNA-binding transcriptional ArsR family regulator
VVVLTIRFTSDDVARTRLAAAPDPVWELVLALQMLRPQRGDLLFSSWRRDARAAMQGAGLGRIGQLLSLRAAQWAALTPNVGYFPDFVTATEPLQLAAGRSSLAVRLTEGLQQTHELLVVPYLRSIRLAIHRDRHLRLAALAGDGVEGLFASLQPMASWSQGEIRIPQRRDQELSLDGRGLLLIPSYFRVCGPLTLFGSQRQPVLIYPVQPGADSLPVGNSRVPESLAALIGLNRAAVLHELASRERNTSELARRVGISAGSVSEHTTALRDAGLITSHRDRNRMLHRVTDLGIAVLERAR